MRRCDWQAQGCERVNACAWSRRELGRNDRTCPWRDAEVQVAERGRKDSRSSRLEGRRDFAWGYAWKGRVPAAGDRLQSKEDARHPDWARRVCGTRRRARRRGRVAISLVGSAGRRFRRLCERSKIEWRAYTRRDVLQGSMARRKDDLRSAPCKFACAVEEGRGAFVDASLERTGRVFRHRALAAARERSAGRQDRRAPSVRLVRWRPRRRRGGRPRRHLVAGQCRRQCELARDRRDMA